MRGHKFEELTGRVTHGVEVVLKHGDQVLRNTMQEGSAFEQGCSILNLADHLIVQLLEQHQHRAQGIAFHALGNVQVTTLARLNHASKVLFAKDVACAVGAKNETTTFDKVSD